METNRYRANPKWFWMMDWCKKQGYPPAQHWAWMLAEEAWEKHIKNEVKL